MNLNERKTIIIMLLLIGGPLVGEAQKISGGSGGFYFGPKFYNTTNYEHFLPANGTLENNLISIGGGGYGVFNNLMLGGYGFFRGGSSEELAIGDSNQDARYYNYQLAGGGGYFTLGYVVYHSKKSILFPQLGIGLEALSISKSIEETLAFDTGQLLSAEYRWGSPMLDLALGYDFFPSQDSGFKIGLRAGYNFSLTENDDWRHNGGDLAGSGLPENNLNGFYVNLVIGGGKIFTK